MFRLRSHRWRADPAKMVIVGVGVVPNVGIGCGAGVVIGNGVRVDRQMRSSIPEILAIGDAASYRHWFSGADVRLEIVQNATDHARLAARTIAGHADSYASVPWFWSDIGDMKLQMVGPHRGQRPPDRLGRNRRKPVLGVPLCWRQADRDRIGQPPGRPHAGPQDDGRQVLPRRGSRRRRRRWPEGGIRRMAASAALKPAVPRQPVRTFSGSCLASTAF